MSRVASQHKGVFTLEHLLIILRTARFKLLEALKEATNEAPEEAQKAPLITAFHHNVLERYVRSKQSWMEAAKPFVPGGIDATAKVVVPFIPKPK